MNLHDRNWEGTGVVILGGAPLMPARIEQSIAAAMPGVEVQLSSFESYDQAYKYCKDNKNVGFLLINENCGDSSFLSTFRELSNHYLSQELPCFGAILYESEPKPLSERLVSKNPAILDYLSIDALINENTVASTMRHLWDQYVCAFESTVLPKQLQDSLIAIAEDVYGVDGVCFLLRTGENLLSDLNTSWLEYVAAKWAPLLIAVEKSTPSVLKPHKSIKYLQELAMPLNVCGIDDVIKVLLGKTPIYQKMTTLLCYLNTQRENGALKDSLDKIAALNKPGAPKLVKHVTSNRERLLRFSVDSFELRKKIG
jgi:hypothetical protein